MPKTTPRRSPNPDGLAMPSPGLGQRDTSPGELPGSGSALFSHAPAPTHDADASPDPTLDEPGWPWFLPEGELPHEALDGRVDAEQDPAGAAANYARIPLVRDAVRLLDFVGEGRQVTSTGALRLADVRALIEQWQLDLSGPALTSMWQVGAIVGPWNALVSGRWLELTGARVRSGPGLVPAVAEQEDPGGYVHFARALLTLLMLDALQQGPQEGGLAGGPDTFAALTRTLAPGGLLLPSTVREAMDRDQVPRTPDGDVDMDEVERYWVTQRDLVTLATYGVLRQEVAPGEEGIRFHGTVEVILEAFGALEMLNELDGQT